VLITQSLFRFTISFIIRSRKVNSANITGGPI
jgi:hypothetical protein